MFTLPQGYSCITRQSDTQLYAYKNNIRDTYIPNGFSWQHTSSSTYSSLPANSVCLTDSFVMPSEFSAMILLSSVIVVLCFLKLILNMFMGVRR